MDINRARSVVLAVAAVTLAACAGEDNGADTTNVVATPAATSTGPVAGGSGLRWRNDAYRELDGDEENAERLVATVSDAPLDSTMVRLEIRTSKDRILYRAEWPAVSYVKYGEPGSANDSVVVLRETKRQMDRIFSDSAFITGEDTPRYPGSVESDQDAIRYDLAEHDYRAAKSLKIWEPLPPGAHDDISASARTVPLARIQAVYAETRGMPAFKYYGGGEENYVVAWSASEGRMVRIAACC